MNIEFEYEISTIEKCKKIPAFFSKLGIRSIRHWSHHEKRISLLSTGAYFRHDPVSKN